MAVGDNYRLSIRYYCGEEWCESSLTYRVEDQIGFDWTQASRLTQLFDIQVIQGAWANIAAANVEVVQLYARRLGLFPGIPSARTMSTLGSIASQALPACAPLALTFYAEAAQRSNRGRVHLSLVPESLTVQGRLTLAGFNLALDLAQSLGQIPNPSDPGQTTFVLVVGHGNEVSNDDVVATRVNPELRVRRSRIARPAFGA